MECITRTTLNIDAAVLSEFKRLSAETHRTLGSLIEDALREHLARRRDVAVTKPVDFPIVGGHGLAPGVDVSSNAGLASFLYGDVGAGEGGPENDT
jgi:hypothetical protein